MTSDREQLRATAVQVRVHLSDTLGDVWWFLFARGFLALALGVAALTWPTATLVLLIRLIAIYALVDGAVGLISAFRAHDLRSNLAPGLVSIAVGVILLFWPGVTGRLLLIVVGLWALFQGAMLILAGLESEKDDPDRTPAIMIGAIAAIVGLILTIWPGTGVVTIAWAIGIAALLIGASLVYLSLRLRKIDRRVENMRRY
jgi:uncharacterized membrane protein HdeD (DUF308 family)